VLAEDAVDLKDPQYAAEYAHEITCYLQQGERRVMADPTYMQRQAKLNAKMRSRLVHWIIKVHEKLELSPQTLFMSINLLDRYLACAGQVVPERLQLVGATVLLLASKYEDVEAADPKGLATLTNGVCSREDILALEVEILNCLGFEFGVFGSSHQFAQRMSKVGELDDKRSRLALELTHLALPVYSMLSFPPSHVAAAAVLVANRTHQVPEPWPQRLAGYTGYAEDALGPCAMALEALLGLNQRRKIAEIAATPSPPTRSLPKAVTPAALSSGRSSNSDVL